MNILKANRDKINRFAILCGKQLRNCEKVGFKGDGLILALPHASTWNITFRNVLARFDTVRVCILRFSIVM